MDYIQAIRCFRPGCEQEQRDQDFFLRFAAKNPDCLSRDNDLAHFTASAWVTDTRREQVLLIYHNIYHSWTWTGGHADGEADLLAVALRELTEETGVTGRPVSDVPISLESLTVDGHLKRGSYVHSHLHLNLTYLLEADPSALLRHKPDENAAVRWFSPEDALAAGTEPWMTERVYRKLNERMRSL